MGYGKWIGGGLGWAFGGPIGALIGFALGSIVEKSGKHGDGDSSDTRQGDFAITFVVLTAAVMKADGKILKSELDFVKKYFLKFFGEQQAKEMLKILKDVLDKEIYLNEVTDQIQRHMSYSDRLQVLHFLYGIAQADGHIAAEEIATINQVALGIGISQADSTSIKNMYIKETDSAYKILEILPTASDEDVKKAYKKMAIKYHPDKVSYLGEEARKAAEEKFKKLTEAYNKIKTQRGIK